MARFGVQDVDNYGGGNNNFFSLSDDKQTAQVRFLYNDINDVEGVALHEVPVGNGNMDIECLRLYNDPVDVCPLCAAGYQVKAKIFVPVYDVKTGETKIWTRGKRFIQKLSSLCTRYNPLVNTIFEVERNGKKGDTNTSYEMYNISTDKKRIEDFPELPAEGIAFFSKTADEMENYLQSGTFDMPQNARRGQQVDEFGRRQPAQQTRQPQREMPVNAPIRRRPNYNAEDNF